MLKFINLAVRKKGGRWGLKYSWGGGLNSFLPLKRGVLNREGTYLIGGGFKFRRQTPTSPIFAT